MGTPRSTIHGLFGALYPIYVRGEAYLALHRGPEAAVEFQKILDHRGIVISDPAGAVAHLELARAYMLSGNKSRAGQAYRGFLLLWKDADPDIPILKQAYAEYSNLSDEKVLFLSDIFPTGYMAAENAQIRPGDTVAVGRLGSSQSRVRLCWAPEGLSP